MLSDFSNLTTLYKIGKEHFSLFGTNVFHVKSREEKIHCYGLTLSSEPRVLQFHVVIWQTTSKNCTKELSMPHVQHNYFSLFNRSSHFSTNQVIDLWCCGSRARPRLLKSLLSTVGQGLSKAKPEVTHNCNRNLL